jgi:hypothetical protein
VKPFVILTAGALAGPVTVELLGYHVPVLSAALSLIGVILASMIAPPPVRPLSAVQRVALVALLSILMLAIVITDPSRSILMTTCWAIGLGYAGLPIIAKIRNAILGRADELIDPLSQSKDVTDVDL